MSDTIETIIIALVVGLIVGCFVFFGSVKCHAMVETSEKDLISDPIAHVLRDLPEPLYPRDYRVIPEVTENLPEAPEDFLYIEEYDPSHTECVRVSDDLMRCPHALTLNADDEIHKELNFDGQLHACPEHRGAVVVCKAKR